MRELHVHFCILDVCHNNALIVVLITYVWLYFTGEFRKAITLAMRRIFRWDKKRRIGNNEENAFIERSVGMLITWWRYGMWLYFITWSHYQLSQFRHHRNFATSTSAVEDTISSTLKLIILLTVIEVLIELAVEWDDLKKFYVELDR